MIKKLLTTAAAGALLFGATTTFAQTASDPNAPKAPTATMEDSTTMPSTTTASGAGYLTQQAPDQISANTYIGQKLYNANNDNVGSINDLIMKKDGGIVAAIVGVGGFLGIGEKNVAVPMENIAVSQNPEGSDMKLTTTETAESLKAAPEFKTLAMQSAERNNANSGVGMTPMDNTTTSSTTPAEPVTPAPAPAQPAQ